MPPYQFFRPLLSPTRAWAAFRWQTFPPADDPAALSETATAAAPLARIHPLFVHCRADWLDAPAFRQLLRAAGATGTTIPCLPAEAAGDPGVEAICRRLRADDGHVAIDVDNDETLRNLPPDAFDHVFIDAAAAQSDIPLIDLIKAHQRGLQLVATGVIDHELFDWACAKRFALASTAFVAARDARTPTDADTTRLKLLKLLSLVVQDADTREIEEIFRQEPKLSYNLLRLVNSVAVAPATPIAGFSQAITVLGRRQLQRWLQLLIYANQFTQGNQPNPLLQMAAARGRQMEELAAALPPDPELPEIGEAAFVVGIFSLLDTLLNMPMDEVLAALPVAPPITRALAGRSGPLGRLLTAITEADADRLETAAALLHDLGITPQAHTAAQVSAHVWASSINIDEHP